MIVGIDHIEIVVTDLERHISFYQTLGFKLLARTTHHGGSAELQLPGENQPIIELHQALIEENPGVNHISFRARDIEGTFASLAKSGINFQSDIMKAKATGRKNALLRDPDGWRLQISDEERGAPA